MSVTWVLNGDSKYEVSSKEHLHQLMHNGSLYTNEGSVPSNFMSADFVQTVEIDLENDDTNIQPIGLSDDSFKGSYDGANLSIKNWSYTATGFDTGSTDDFLAYVGLFGYVFHPCVLKNIRMTGVCTLRGFTTFGGILLGYSNSATISNIDLELDEGSLIEQGDVPNGYSNMGGVVGQLAGGSMYGVTLSGELDVVPGPNMATQAVGCVIGYAGNTIVTLVRNLAKFTSTVTGYNVGGVFGDSSAVTITKVLNAMEGSLLAAMFAGGIFGKLRTTGSSQVVGELVNSMNGDIEVTGAGFCAGIVGYLYSSLNHDKWLNYMSGDIVSAVASRSAGIIGQRVAADYTFTNTLNAMKGSTYHAGLPYDHGETMVYIDTEFGLTYTDSLSTALFSTMDTSAFTLDPETSLPVIALTGTDSESVAYDWEFVFGNNTTIEFVARPLHVDVKFGEVPGATQYRLTKQLSPDGVETTVDTDFSTFEKRAESLQSESVYVFRVYSRTDPESEYTLAYQSSTTTLANVSSNYSAGDYKAEGEDQFDLSSFDKDTMANFHEVMNEVFDTGDAIVIPIGSETKKTKFVKLGGSVPIDGESAVLIPFLETGGSAQTASLTLSDNSSVTLTYDETAGTIGIGGVDYSPGESTIVDSQKLTLVEV
ncbi:unknown [Feldmannia species virus]|uniref:Uncharacterized protein n=1 Tax=Feldmannia species virus TaxID=39420 RepID=B5LWE4_9PHYC|nr:hypothetical protein FeldSpV_gp055 [Feldmannia species virus]ACH46807.1 unknown [Feldmannia species virus]